MKHLYSYIIIAILSINLTPDSFAQGCVAIRSGGGCSMGAGGSAILQQGQLQIVSSFRYFHSFRHFRGKEEETERVALGTEVINDSYFLDLSFTYAFAPRFYASVTFPFVYHERSSMYEHGGNNLRDRHKTYAKGLSDMRISAGYWLLPEEKHSDKNIAMAIGIKLPTGDYNATGTFYNAGPNGEPVVRPVDQSIQPGDGGVGATIELQGYYLLGQRIGLTTNLYYLINPQEHNGTRRRPGADPYASPDQYTARLSASYSIPSIKTDFYLGGRLEGVPVYDLIGGSNAYRRPGYAISVEPGINFTLKNILINFSVPIAVERNRTQSYLDKQREQETGQPRHGDAAFADYLINVGVAYRLSGNNSKMDTFNTGH